MDASHTATGRRWWPLPAWLRELAIVLGFYYGYEIIRHFGGQSTTTANHNANMLVGFEKWLNIFHERSVQQAFLGWRWFIRTMNVYYGTLHFVITGGLLIWMFVRRRGGYRHMRNLLGATTGLALIGYYSFPLTPPRSYACNCFVDTLDSVGGLWSYHSSAAKAIANPFAAMPSLHFGWALWCTVVLIRFARHRWARWIGVVYPLLTLLAIVVTANHYFLDAAGGAVTFGVASWLVGWRERRRSAALAE